MKACFIVGTLARGGAERQLVFMLKAAKSEGIQPRLLCLTRGEAFEDEIRDLGIEVEWVGKLQNRALRLSRIVMNLRKRPADIIHSSHFYTNLYAAAAGRILDIPSIGAIRSDLFSEIAASRRLGRAQITWPSHLIVNSKVAENRAVSQGILPRRLTFIKNVVEPTPPRCDHSNRREVSILFVGRLVRVKRPDRFIDLADRLRKSLPGVNLKFQMVGGGDLRPELETLVRERGFSEQEFRMPGEQEQKQMSAFYQSADILVLTSEYEGTPNVILEAMSCGLPVVATNVGGVPEVLTERCGSLVDPSDCNGMVDAVSQLVLDPQLRAQMGAEGRKYVAANHSLDYLQQRLKRLYSDLTQR